MTASLLEYSTPPIATPSLEWINSTSDLSGFTRASNKRIVREQVMKDYLFKQQPYYVNRDPRPRSRRCSPPGQRTQSSPSRHGLRSSKHQTTQLEPFATDALLRRDSFIAEGYPPTAADLHNDQEADHPYYQLRRYRKAFASINPTGPITSSNISKRLVDYKGYTKYFPPNYDVVKYVLLPWGSAGALGSAPKSLIDVRHIKFHCVRFLGSEGAAQIWAILCSTSHYNFNNLCLASAHLDAMRGEAKESQTTLVLKIESTSKLNEAIRDECCDLSVIQAIVYVICTDFIIGHGASLETNEKGLEIVVRSRGGLEHLGQMMAGLLSIVSLHSAILQQRQPKAIYGAYCSAYLSQIGLLPLHQPHVLPLGSNKHDIPTLVNSSHCHGLTFEILCDMKELCDFILEAPEIYTDATSFAMTTRISEIYENIINLPTGGSLHCRVYDDWVYESCRITACIYATAVHNRISLSVAADMLPPPKYDPSIIPLHNQSTTLRGALMAAMVRANDSHCWVDYDMAWEYLHITLIGSAACSTLSGGALAEDVWNRKRMVAKSVQCIASLAFDEMDAVLWIIMRISKVVEILSRGET